jgi:hypothetical protein
MPQATVVDQGLLERGVIDAAEVPLYEQVLAWTSKVLRPEGLSRPLCKRLAVVVSGLVASEKATLGELSSAVKGLALSQAKDESIARRLQRVLRDNRLEPSLLPRIFRPLAPELLSSFLEVHAESARSSGSQHARFRGLVVVLDESSQEDDVHLAVVGIPIGALVVPLSVRTWGQNVSMPEWEYWTQITGMLQEVQTMLPAELRPHVLLVADRLYGVPKMLDILMALGWNWLLRVQGQTRVLFEDGSDKPLRTLVPMPGTQWLGKFTKDDLGSAPEVEIEGVFKSAGWRRSQVVAFWAQNQPEPWLLLTSLDANRERVTDYAQRWAIERLFLSWKSHGWDIEASGIHDPARLGHLLTALAIATLWRLAMALPAAYAILRDLTGRVARAPRQLRLPGYDAPPRPWPSRFGLFTWGFRVASQTPLSSQSPPLCWRLPNWHDYTWQTLCRMATLQARRQFPITA